MPSTEPRCFYFGCWNKSGHYLFLPGGNDPSRVERERIVYYTAASGELNHLDGTLAPRRVPADLNRYWDLKAPWWQGAARSRREADIAGIRTGEYPQGHFLVHHLDNGYTAIQFWDRCQGDKRGACNSTILLEGKHTSEEMLEALKKHFPHVLENLERHGVKLVEVQKEET